MSTPKPPHTCIDAMHFCIQYILYLVLEADEVEEAHSEVSSLLGLATHLNLISTVRMVLSKRCAEVSHQPCCALVPSIGYSQLLQSLKAELECIQQKGI